MEDPLANIDAIDQEAREKLPKFYSFVEEKLREYYVAKPYMRWVCLYSEHLRKQGQHITSPPEHSIL